jgi:hypothetical protein
VEGVHLVHGQEVDELEDILLGKKMPRDVEQETPPAEAGRVLDEKTGKRERAGGHFPGKDVGRQELQDRLDTVEESRRGRSFKKDLVILDIETVTFCP